MSDCVDETHFREVNGVISPQPWMQWRHVGGVEAPSKAATYNVSGGGNKNELIHNLQQLWVNTSPLPQWVYGLVTRGGATVALQARSRGGLSLLTGQSGYNEQINENWEGSVTPWGTLPAGASVATDAFYSGTKSMKLVGGNTISFTRSGIFPVSPGETVTLTGRARRDNAYNGTGATASSAYVLVRNQANSASPFTNSASAAIFSTSMASLTWVPFSKTFTIPETGVTGIRLAIVGAHGAGNIWLDDLVVSRGTLDPALVEASVMGIGAEMGKGGVLALGSSFATMEQRQNSLTIPLAPEKTGWTRVEPGGTFVGKAQLRFITQFWENTIIDGGDTGTMSGWVSGDTRLDLFAVPVL